MSTYAMVLNDTVIGILVDQEKEPRWPNTPSGEAVNAIVCESNVQIGMKYIQKDNKFVFPEIPTVGDIETTEQEEPQKPEPTQLDRIESALALLTADTVTSESINTAISEGVNEV